MQQMTRFDDQVAVFTGGGRRLGKAYAGIVPDKSFTKMSSDDLSLLLDVHLKGTFFATQSAFKAKDCGYERILFTALGSDLWGNYGQANYAAAKMGDDTEYEVPADASGVCSFITASVATG